MSSIRGVNVGGNSFNITDSSNIAPLNSGNFAVRDYAKDRFMIREDGLLYRATVAIASGDPLVINGNIKQSNIDEVISTIETDSDLIAPTEDGATSSDDYAVGAQIARNGLLYEVIDAIAEGDAFVVDNNIQLAGSVSEQLNSLNEALTKQTLYFTSVACSATTGNFATVSNANISADHVVVECTFANPSAITTDVTWTTANGSLTLNGTCASATTANITLSKKGN